MEVANYRKESPEFRPEVARRILTAFLQPECEGLADPTIDPTITRQVAISAEFRTGFTPLMYINPEEANNVLNIVGQPLQDVMSEILKAAMSIPSYSADGSSLGSSAKDSAKGRTGADSSPKSLLG